MKNNHLQWQKKWIVCLVLLFTLLLCLTAMAETAEKYDTMPAHFEVKVHTTQTQIDDQKAYMVTECLETTNKDVNQQLAAIVDTYASTLRPLLLESPHPKGYIDSQLDVDTVYYRTGDAYISTLVLGQVCHFGKQTELQFCTQTYDLMTGTQIALPDLFEKSSPAWDILAQGIRDQLSAVFPDRKKDEAVLDQLCTYESMKTADFTLSGASLTLHYDARLFFEDEPHILHVRFYYPQFENMMTAIGQKATDNHKWKMVAITCDDGPKEITSMLTLKAFRHAGMRATYFVVGKQVERLPELFKKEMNQNHSFGSHTYVHYNGYTYKRPGNKTKELNRMDALTLSIIGLKAPFFRAPGGVYPPWVEEGVTVPVMMWTLDTYDYTGKEPERILYSIEKNLEENDVILCHDTGKFFNKAVPLISEYFLENGYMAVTLEELASIQNVEPLANVVYRNFCPGMNSNDGTTMWKEE